MTEFTCTQVHLVKKNPDYYKKIIIIHMSDSRIYVTYQQVGSVCIKSTCWQMINDLLTTHIEPFFEKLSIHDYRLSTLRKEEGNKCCFQSGAFLTLNFYPFITTCSSKHHREALSCWGIRKSAPPPQGCLHSAPWGC